MELSDAELRALRSCAPFQDLTADDVRELLPVFHSAGYRAGDRLWRPGDPASDLWFLLSGQLHTIYTSEDGEEVVTQFAVAGQSFGEPALFLEQGERIVSVVALTDCRTLRLAKEPLLRFLERHPPALRRMLESLSRMVVAQSALFGQLAFHQVRGRVAYQLLKLSDEYGIPTTAGRRLPLKLSQSTLAGLVGSTRESVNRVLSALAADGVISRTEGTLVILDVDRLRQELGF